MSKKIFFLIDKIRDGGAERILLRIASFLKKNGYDITIMSNYKISKQFSRNLDDFRCVNIGIKEKTGIAFKVYSWIVFIFKAFFVLKKEKPDLVISFLERSNWVNLVISLLTKHKTIVSTRNNLSLQYKNIVKKFFAKILINLYNKANLVISLSEGVRRDLIENFGVKEEKIITIYNPYPIRLIEELSRKPLNKDFEKLFHENKIIITMGRLTKQKGHEYLIRAFKKVKDYLKKCNIKLLILGEGPLKNMLFRLICELDLENDVKILGFQDNPYSFLARADVFIFPSLWEGWGNAIIEAMICKLPVIASDCDFGPREILSKKLEKITSKVEYSDFGILVALNDLEENLSKAIIELLSNPCLVKKYKECGYYRALDFSEEKILKVWEKVITNITNIDC